MALDLFAIRASIALLLGLLIGMERQWRQRHAGIRTYSLVALGSSMYVMLALLSGDESSPSRIPLLTSSRESPWKRIMKT